MVSEAASDPDVGAVLAQVIQSRRTVLPRRLQPPAPHREHQRIILEAVACAPDHDQILPWRFIEVPADRRDDLGAAFEQALRERDAGATQEQLAQAREKAHRGPWLMLLVVRTGGEPQQIPAAERLVSAGAAVQNMLLMATALGYGSSLTSGKAMKAAGLRQLFRLDPSEDAVCFISIGTVGSAPKPRARPRLDAYFAVMPGTIAPHDNTRDDPPIKH